MTLLAYDRELSFRYRRAYIIWRIGALNALPIKQKPHTLRVFSTPLAKGIHEFFELGDAFDLEEDLVVVIGDLDV